MLRLPPITDAVSRYIETLNSEALRDPRRAMVPRLTSNELEQLRDGTIPLIPEVRSVLSRFWSPDHGPGFLNLMRRGALIARTPAARSSLTEQAGILDFLRMLHQRGLRPGMASDRVRQETGGQGPLELPAWEGRRFVGEVQVPQAALSQALMRAYQKGVIHQPLGRFGRLPSLRHIEFSQNPMSGGIPLFLRELAEALHDPKRGRFAMGRISSGGHVVRMPQGSSSLSFLNPDPDAIEPAPEAIDPRRRRVRLDSDPSPKMFSFLKADEDGEGARSAAFFRFLSDFWKDRSDPAAAAGLFTALEADPSTTRPADVARIKLPDIRESRLLELSGDQAPEMRGDDSGERDASWRDEADLKARASYRRALEAYYDRTREFPFGKVDLPAVRGYRPSVRHLDLPMPMDLDGFADPDGTRRPRTITLPNPRNLPDPEQLPPDEAKSLTTRLAALASALGGEAYPLTRIPNRPAGRRRFPFMDSKEDFKALSRMLDRRRVAGELRQIARAKRDGKDPTTASIEEISRSVARAANHPKERLMESLSGSDLPSQAGRLDPSRVVVPDPKGAEERWTLVEDKTRQIPPAADRFNRPKSGRGGRKKAKRIKIDTPPAPLSDPKAPPAIPPLSRYASSIDSVMAHMARRPSNRSMWPHPKGGRMNLAQGLVELSRALGRMAGSDVRTRNPYGRRSPWPKMAPSPDMVRLLPRLERMIRDTSPGRGGAHENRLADPSDAIERARRIAVLLRAAGGVR